MAELSCPNCGYGVTPELDSVRVLDCPSCGTSLFLDDDVFRKAGESGEMHDAPALFGLGDAVVIGGSRLVVHGHVRFSYGRGWWDEYWAVTGEGDEAWLSVDEGDVTAQVKVARGVTGGERTYRPGQTIDHDGEGFTVTDVGKAECIARRGSFSERLSVGETYRFVDAMARDGRLLSGEFWPRGEAWFLGRWYDPFEIRVEEEAA